MNKHRVVRKHISAAKGWLSKAEDSIEQENELRGDLNLMLAQAELKRAQEKRPTSLWLRWLKRLAPLAAAILLAAGYFAYAEQGQEAPREAMLPQPVTELAPAESGEQPAVQLSSESSVEAGTHAAESVAVPVVEGQEVAGQAAVGVSEERTAGAENAESTELTVPAVPTREMQKLMRNAGSILRE